MEVRNIIGGKQEIKSSLKYLTDEEIKQKELQQNEEIAQSRKNLFSSGKNQITNESLAKNAAISNYFNDDNNFQEFTTGSFKPYFISTSDDRSLRYYLNEIIDNTIFKIDDEGFVKFYGIRIKKDIKKYKFIIKSPSRGYAYFIIRALYNVDPLSYSTLYKNISDEYIFLSESIKNEDSQDEYNKFIWLLEKNFGISIINAILRLVDDIKKNVCKEIEEFHSGGRVSSGYSEIYRNYINNLKDDYLQLCRKSYFSVADSYLKEMQNRESEDDDEKIIRNTIRDIEDIFEQNVFSISDLNEIENEIHIIFEKFYTVIFQKNVIDIENAAESAAKISVEFNIDDLKCRCIQFSLQTLEVQYILANILRVFTLGIFTDINLYIDTICNDSNNYHIGNNCRIFDDIENVLNHTDYEKELPQIKEELPIEYTITELRIVESMITDFFKENSLSQNPFLINLRNVYSVLPFLADIVNSAKKYDDLNMYKDFLKQ